MKFDKSWLVYLGIGAAGIGAVLYMMYKRSGKSLAQIGTDKIIGKGRSDNIPVSDTSKGTRLLQAAINPHDTYTSILDRKSISVYDDFMGEDWIVDL